MISTRTTRRVSSLAAAFVGAAVLVAGATVPAYAKDPTGEVKPVSAEAAADKTRYCFIVQNTGSIVSKRVCRTRADWIASTGFDPAHKK